MFSFEWVEFRNEHVLIYTDKNGNQLQILNSPIIYNIEGLTARAELALEQGFDSIDLSGECYVNEIILGCLRLLCTIKGR